MAISFLIGFLFQTLVVNYKIKIFLFILAPMITFLLLLPLPNGSTPLIIFKKFLVYHHKQKKYRLKF